MSSLLAEVLDAQRQAEEDELADEGGLLAGAVSNRGSLADNSAVWEKNEDAWVRTHTGWGGSRGSTRSMLGSSDGYSVNDGDAGDDSVLVASLRRLLDNATVAPVVGVGYGQICGAWTRDI